MQHSCDVAIHDAASIETLRVKLCYVLSDTTLWIHICLGLMESVSSFYDPLYTGLLFTCGRQILLRLLVTWAAGNSNTLQMVVATIGPCHLRLYQQQNPQGAQPYSLVEATQVNLNGNAKGKNYVRRRSNILHGIEPFKRISSRPSKCVVVR